MHELSIAQSILDIIVSNVPEDQLHYVRTVSLKVGKSSGIVPESLEFCFMAITAETNLCQARLNIEKIPFVIHCHTCGLEQENEVGSALCASCGSVDTTILSGTEMQFSEIELDEVA
ncbi:MAG: hydrogenase maturation nickel metallochaperone HypA [Ignavibacteriales bacterium]|nr:hydrogenase maturation nickel metallochaperone HypA [Ignavibacteriales bacterium]